MLTRTVKFSLVIPQSDKFCKVNSGLKEYQLYSFLCKILKFPKKKLRHSSKKHQGQNQSTNSRIGNCFTQGQPEICSELKQVMTFSLSPLQVYCNYFVKRQADRRQTAIATESKLRVYNQGRYHTRLKMQEEFPYTLGVNDPPPT